MIKQGLSLLLRYALGIGIVLWLYKGNQINLNAVSVINWQIIMLALALCIVQLVLSAWRVKYLLAAHQIFVSTSRCILYNATGIFYSTLLPGGMSGDAARAYYLWRCKHKRGNNSKSGLIGALVTDRLIGTVAMLFVGLTAATFSAKSLGISSTFLWVVWTCFSLALCAYVYLCSTHKYQWNFSEQSRLGRLAKHLKQILAKLDLRDYPNRVLAISAILSILIHIIAVLVIFIFASVLHSGLNFSQIMAIAPVGLLINALPLSPGGIGVGEKGFEFLFSVTGGYYGGSVFLLARIFLFSPAILGAITSAFLLVRRHRFDKPLLIELETC